MERIPISNFILITIGIILCAAAILTMRQTGQTRSQWNPPVAQHQNYERFVSCASDIGYWEFLINKETAAVKATFRGYDGITKMYAIAEQQDRRKK